MCNISTHCSTEHLSCQRKRMTNSSDTKKVVYSLQHTTEDVNVVSYGQIFLYIAYIFWKDECYIRVWKRVWWLLSVSLVVRRKQFWFDVPLFYWFVQIRECRLGTTKNKKVLNSHQTLFFIRGLGTTLCCRDQEWVGQWQMSFLDGYTGTNYYSNCLPRWQSQ